MMKKILVTGGAGFLGSHLCERLIDEGNIVMCVDNYFTGNKENIIHLMENNFFEFIHHDIIFPLYIEVDEIYNLACPASPVHYQYDPVQTTKTSVHGSINMLGLAKRTQSKILLASTSEVYGNPSIHPQTEDYFGNVNSVGPRSCYDEGKRCAETLFFDYYREHNLRIKVARIFNTYGPRMYPNDGRVVSNFIMQALFDKDITIYGDGKQTRSFCYVDNLIEGLIKLMNSSDEFTGPVNIGNPEEISILKLCDKIKKLTGSQSKLVYENLPKDDPLRRQPDISLANKMLGWVPTINIDQGLNRTIQYFKDFIKYNQLQYNNKNSKQYLRDSLSNFN